MAITIPSADTLTRPGFGVIVTEWSGPGIFTGGGLLAVEKVHANIGLIGVTERAATLS
jgi:hypothetical protein